MNLMLHFSNANMKTLLGIVILLALNNTIKCESLKETQIIIKSLSPPKKLVKQSNIKIMNARKFGNLHALESRRANVEKKREYKESYTVFPPIPDKRLLEDPDSTYFVGDVLSDRKARVKKVLPEYSSVVFRRKRSINNDTKLEEIANEKDSNRRRNRKTIKDDRKNKPRRIRKTKKLDKVKKLARQGNQKDNISDVKKNKQKKRSTVQLKYAKKVNNTMKIQSKKNVVKKNKKAKRERENRHQERKEISRRLIAGRDAMIQDYPYVVSIQKGNEHWCAGALLNPRLVITTANCVWKARSVSRMRIRAGTRHMARGGQVAKIQEVVKHPGWSIRSQPDYDVALLLLDRNIKFSDKVHGVDLPNRAMWPAFEDVWVTSWGSDRRDGIFQGVAVSLQVYHAILIDHDKCNNITQRFGVAVTRNFICVAQTGRRAPCTRDTGAPAVSDGILWGLASWGIRKLCGTERFPAMFSYLASRSNLDFITNATHYLMSDKRFYPYPDRYIPVKAETTSSPETTTFTY
ncbi:transmembrane protease serine 5-like [Nymphalis io]|uniref:transmembrane protease serine 5-like n=1 Tax=Inachis io TaxID=171585 RepID=UPI002169AF6D|nr:transmembrane protease serine 5-like [Nymphalis io]